MKWNELIQLCLRDSGVVGSGQTPSGQMIADAKARMNMMIGEWRADEMLIYQIADSAFTCTGSNVYTIGPAANFPTDVRPDEITYAFLRQLIPANPTPVDFPLAILKAPIDYAHIYMKLLTAAPANAIWFDQGYPIGHVYIYPVPIPAGSWQLHLGIPTLLDEVVDLDDDVILPPRYYRALYNNHCVDLGTAFRIDPKPIMIRRANASLKAIRRKNARIPRMRMPAGLSRGRTYNPYSDRP